MGGCKGVGISLLCVEVWCGTIRCIVDIFVVLQWNNMRMCPRTHTLCEQNIVSLPAEFFRTAIK